MEIYGINDDESCDANENAVNNMCIRVDERQIIALWMVGM